MDTDIIKIRNTINDLLYLKQCINYYFEINELDKIDFEDIQRCLEILYKNEIDAYIWLINLGKYSFKIDSSQWEANDKFILGIKKANIFYLKNIINEFDNKYNLKDGLSNIYSELVDDNIIIYDGNYNGFKFNYKFNRIKNIKEFDIIFPVNFTMWNIDDLIESIYGYITEDTIYNIHKWFEKKPILTNQNEIIEKLNKIIERYYFIRTKRRLELYEEELMQKTWNPNRLFTWCLDEEEKKDFEYTN